MKFGRHHAMGIYYMPVKFDDDRIRNIVSNLVFTHTRGVAVNSHFLIFIKYTNTTQAINNKNKHSKQNVYKNGHQLRICCQKTQLVGEKEQGALVYETKNDVVSAQ